MPHELDMEIGGALPYNNGPHQFDVVRMMGGGMVRSVRGSVSKWMDARTSPGYYVAYLEFEDDTPATIVKNGYGYFMTTELVPWAHDVPERQRNRDLRKALRNGTPFDEASGKEAQRFGGSDTNTLLGRARKRPPHRLPARRRSRYRQLRGGRHSPVRQRPDHLRR